jgi:DNA-binding Lrp family transcriptional regulator
MPEAFVCINASPDSVEDVFQELKACDDVQEAFMVHGVYDIIARVNGETFEDLNNIIDRRIKRLSQVQTVLSILMIPSKAPITDGELLLV